MDNHKRALRNGLKIGLVIIVVMAIYLFVSRVVLFTVTNVTPSGGTLPTSVTTLVFTFNKELADDNGNKVVELDPDVKYVVKITGKVLSVYLESPLDANSTLSVHINNLKSKNNKSFSKTFTFTSKYVAYDKLSDAEREAQVARTDSLENDFPIMKDLPIVENHFQISYRLPDANAEKMPIIITSLTALPRPTTLQGDYIPLTSSDPQVVEYTSQVRIYRQEAVDHLNKLGFDKNKYNLYFSEPVFTQEFGGKYVGELDGQDN